MDRTLGEIYIECIVFKTLTLSCLKSFKINIKLEILQNKNYEGKISICKVLQKESPNYLKHGFSG